MRDVIGELIGRLFFSIQIFRLLQVILILLFTVRSCKELTKIVPHSRCISKPSISRMNRQNEDSHRLSSSNVHGKNFSYIWDNTTKCGMNRKYRWWCSVLSPCQNCMIETREGRCRSVMRCRTRISSFAMLMSLHLAFIHIHFIIIWSQHQLNFILSNHSISAIFKIFTFFSASLVFVLVHTGLLHYCQFSAGVCVFALHSTLHSNQFRSNHFLFCLGQLPLGNFFFLLISVCSPVI